MIDVISKGIGQLYNSSQLKNLIGDRLFFTQASQNVTFPYIVFFLNSITQDEIMGDANNNITSVDIQFNLFSDNDDGGQSAAELVELLSDLFHWTTDLNITGYRTIKMQRTNIINLETVDNIWQSTVDYELWIQKE